MPSTSKQVTTFFDAMEGQFQCLGYGDVRLRPYLSDLRPGEADTASRFSKRVPLKVPIVGAAMDTVTEAPMAIALAKLGGLGIIHKNLSPREQAKHVGRVKRHLHGHIDEPVPVFPEQRIDAVLAWRSEKRFGFHSFPVLDKSGVLVGLVTRSNFRFARDPSATIAEIMTPLAQLTVAREVMSYQDAYDLMRTHSRKVLPIVDANGKFHGMYVLSDLERIVKGTGGYNVDASGQLLVGAAVGVGDGALERAKLLAAKRCDVFVVDTAHGDSQVVFETIRALKSRYPHIDVVAGNVSSADGARHLCQEGVDGILIGQGPGAICTTRIVAGIGVPQATAVYECSKVAYEHEVPACADGGITNSGDIVVALAIGASSVMLGRLLAGTDEAPGTTELVGNVPMKRFRGMGSLGAMRDGAGSRERYGQSDRAESERVPEGVEALVPARGPVARLFAQYRGGLLQGMWYHGARNLKELRANARIFRVTAAGMRESHPHDVVMESLPPNYLQS